MLAVALGASACSSGGSGPSAGPETTALGVAPSAETAGAEPDAATNAEATVTSAASPAVAGMSVADQELLTTLYTLLDVGTRDEVTAWFAAGTASPAVIQCMTDAGFQYTAGPSAEERVASDLRYTLSPEEYAARYGLGITGWDLGLFPPSEQSDDPNHEYVSSLSSGQRDAYRQAEAACWDSADPHRSGRANALSVAVEEFRGVVAADDRTVAAQQVWQACLAAAGYTFDSPMAMRESFYTRMNSGLRRDDLERLNTEEVAVAVVDVPCEAAYTADYRAVVLDRFGEFRTLYDTAFATGAAPEAAG